MCNPACCLTLVLLGSMGTSTLYVCPFATCWLLFVSFGVPDLLGNPHGDFRIQFLKRLLHPELWVILGCRKPFSYVLLLLPVFSAEHIDSISNPLMLAQLCGFTWNLCKRHVDLGAPMGFVNYDMPSKHPLQALRICCCCLDVQRGIVAWRSRFVCTSTFQKLGLGKGIFRKAWSHKARFLLASFLGPYPSRQSLRIPSTTIRSNQVAWSMPILVMIKNGLSRQLWNGECRICTISTVHGILETMNDWFAQTALLQAYLEPEETFGCSPVQVNHLYNVMTNHPFLSTDAVILHVTQPPAARLGTWQVRLLDNMMMAIASSHSYHAARRTSKEEDPTRERPMSQDRTCWLSLFSLQLCLHAFTLGLLAPMLISLPTLPGRRMRSALPARRAHQRQAHPDAGGGPPSLLLKSPHLNSLKELLLYACLVSDGCVSPCPSDRSERTTLQVTYSHFPNVCTPLMPAAQNKI